MTIFIIITILVAIVVTWLIGKLMNIIINIFYNSGYKNTMTYNHKKRKLEVSNSKIKLLSISISILILIIFSSCSSFREVTYQDVQRTNYTAKQYIQKKRDNNYTAYLEKSRKDAKKQYEKNQNSHK